MKLFRKSSILFFAASASVTYAGVTHSLQHTATTVQPGAYEARGQLDLILNHGGGANISGHFRTGLIDDMLDIEGYVGTGKTDFKIGVLSEFNLLPDLPGQVGLGFLGGLSFLNDDYGPRGAHDTITALSFAFLASKKMDISFGKVTPYGGLQMEMLFKAGENVFPLTGIVGAEWLITDVAPWTFFSELNIELNKSVYLLAGGAAYHF